MPDVNNLGKRIVNYAEVNKIEQDEAKKALEKEDTRQDEEGVSGIETFDADESVIAEQEYKAMIDRLRLAGKLETINLVDSDGNDLGISVLVNKSETGANYSYTFKDNKLTINANKCIVSIGVNENLTDAAAIDAAKQNAANIEVVFSGVHVKLNSDVAVKQITSSAINAIINGSNDADTIISTGMNTTVNARGGNDTVVSKGMKDVVRGGSGNDNITATGMGSNVFGTEGRNTISANGVGMFIDSGKGESTLNVHGNSIAISGGVSGNNQINAQGQDIKVISGNASNDITLSGTNVSVEYDNETTGDVNTADKIVINGETVQEKVIDEANGFDANGYRTVSDGKGGTRKLNYNGYDANGYNIDGYNAQGYNARGLDKDNYNIDGYKAVTGTDGETRLVDKDGYDQDGYNPDKIGTDEYYKGDYNEYGFDENGYDKDGYNMWGVDRNGNSQVHNDGFDANGRLWQNGKLYTGIYSVNNLMYEKGDLLTGVSSVDQKLYKSGELDKVKQDYKGKLYTDGSLDTTKQDFNNVLYIGGSKSTNPEDEFERKLYHNGSLTTGTILSSTNKLYTNGSLAPGLIQYSGNNLWYNNGELANGKIGDKYFEGGVEKDEPEHPENGIDALGRRWINNELANDVIVDETEKTYEGTTEKATLKEYHLYDGGFLSTEENKVVNDNGKKYLFYKGSLVQGEYLYKQDDVEILFQQGTPASGLVTYGEKTYYNGYKADGAIYENGVPTLYAQGNVDTTEKLVPNINNPYTNKTETVLFKDGTIASGLETFGGVTYYNGTPATGEYNGSTYENGQKVTGKVVADDGKLYVDGDLADGTQEHDDKLYVDGVKTNVAETEHDGKLYLSGEKATGTQVSNTNVLYIDGEKAAGNQEYNGTLYVDGERAQGVVGEYHYTDGQLTNGTVNGVEYVGGEVAFNPATAVEATEDVVTAVVNLAMKVSASFGAEIQNVAASTTEGVSLVNVKYTDDGSAIKEFTVTTENGTRTYHINYYDHEPVVEHETHRYADRTETIWRYYYVEGALRREEVNVLYNNNTYKYTTNEYAEDGLNTRRIIAETDVDGNYTKSWYELDKDNKLYLDCKHYNGVDANGDKCNSWEYFYQSGALKNNDIVTYYKDGSSYGVENTCTESGMVKTKIEIANDTMGNYTKLWYELDENNDLYASCSHSVVKDAENKGINIWEYFYVDGSVKSKDITTTFVNGDTHNVYEAYTKDGTVKSRTETENIDEGHYTKVWYDLDNNNELYVSTKHNTVTNEDGTKFNTWEYYYEDGSVNKTETYVEEVNGIKKNEIITAHVRGEKTSTIADIDNHGITAENTVTTVEHNSDSTIKKFTVVSGTSMVEGLINYYDTDDYYVHRYEDGASIWEYFRADKTIKAREILYSNGNALDEKYDHNGKTISKTETIVSEQGTTKTWSELNADNELYVTTRHYTGVDKNGDKVNEWDYYYENHSVKSNDIVTYYKDGSSYAVENQYTENGTVKSKIETAWDTMGNYAKLWYELDENNELYVDCSHFSVKDAENNGINIWQYHYTDGSVKSKDITTTFVNGDYYNITEYYTKEGMVKSKTETENIDEGHYTRLWYDLDDNNKLYVSTKHHTDTYADGTKLNTWEYLYPDGSVKKTDIYTEEVNGIKKNEEIKNYAIGEKATTIVAIDNHDITAANTVTTVEHNEDTTVKKFVVVSGNSMVEGLINYYDSDDYYVHRYEDGASIWEYFRADKTIKSREIYYANGESLNEKYDHNGKTISRTKTEKSATGTITRTWEELDANNELYVVTRHYYGLDSNGNKTNEWDYYYEDHSLKNKDVSTYYSDGSSRHVEDEYTQSGIHKRSIVAEYDKDGNYRKTWNELNEKNELYLECEHYNGVDDQGDKCNSWKYYRPDNTLKSIDVTTYYTDGSNNNLSERYAEDGITVIDRTRSATHADGHYIREWYDLDANGNIYRSTVHTTTTDANGASVNTWEYYYTDGVTVKSQEQRINRTDGTVEETVTRYDTAGNITYKSVYTQDSETTQTVYYLRNEATGELYKSRVDKKVSRVSDDGTKNQNDIDYYPDGVTKKQERIDIRYPNGSRHEENINYSPDETITGKTLEERDVSGNTLYVRYVLDDNGNLYAIEKRYHHYDEAGNRIDRTETYYDDGSLKSFSETIRDVSGHTTTRSHENYAKGTVQGEIGEDVFKSGFYEEEIDGEIVRVHYTGGARTTGKVGDIMYKNGLPANGDVNNSLYKNGILDTTNQIYDGRLYLGGSIPKGYARYTADGDVEKLYNNGILYTGKCNEDMLMYESGLVLSGISSVNQKLYKDGIVDITKQDYEGRLYKNGVLQTKTQEFEVGGVTRLYIGGYFASDKPEYTLKVTDDTKLFLNGVWATDRDFYEYNQNRQLFINGVLSKNPEDEYNNHLYRNGEKVYGWAVSGSTKLYANGELYTEKTAYDGKLFNEGSLDTVDQAYNCYLYIGGYLSTTKRDFENKLYGEDGRLDTTTQGFVVNGTDRLYIDGEFAQNTPAYALKTDTTVKLYKDGVFASNEAEYEFEYYYFENGVLSNKSDVTLGSGKRYLKGLLVEERGYNTYVGGEPYTGDLDGVHYERGVHEDGIDPNTGKYWLEGMPADGIVEIEGQKRLYNNGDWNQAEEAEWREYEDGKYKYYLFENGVLSTAELKLSKTNKLYTNGVLTSGRIEYGSGSDMRVFYNGEWANGYLPVETGDTNYYINGRVSDPSNPDIPGVDPDAEITGGVQASSAAATKAKSIISTLVASLPEGISYHNTYAADDIKDATIYDAVYTGSNLTSFTVKLPLVVPSTGTTAVHYNVTYSGSNVATITEQVYSENVYSMAYSGTDSYNTHNYSACRYYYEGGKVSKVEDMSNANTYAYSYSYAGDTEDSTITYIEYDSDDNPKYMRLIGESAVIYNYASNDTRNHITQGDMSSVNHTDNHSTAYEASQYEYRTIHSGDHSAALTVSHSNMMTYSQSLSDSSTFSTSVFDGDLLTKRTQVSSEGSNYTIECTYNSKNQLLTEKCINGGSYVGDTSYDSISFVYGSCSTATYTVTYTYNAMDLPSKVTQTDDYGNVIRTIDYTYNTDKLYATVTMTDTDGSVVTKEYKYNDDKMIKEYKYTDKYGQVTTTTYEYNSAKLPKTISQTKDTEVTTVEYTYNSKGQIVAEHSETNTSGSGTQIVNDKEYRYDTNARLVYEKSESKTKYDSQEEYTITSSSTTTYSRYDNGDYQSITTIEDNASETTTSVKEYDTNGFLVAERIDEVGKYSSEDNMSRQIAYTYDADGYMTRKVVTGTNAHTETYTYHDNNNVASYTNTSPTGGTTLINYDNKGKITTKTTTRGEDSVTETYTYTTNGSIAQINSSDGSYTHYTYDAKGMLSGIATKESEGTEKTETYTYDSAGRLSKIEIDGEVKKEITYDSKGVKLTEKEYVAESSYYGMYTVPAHTIEKRYNSHGQITYDSTVYTPEGDYYKTTSTTYEYDSTNGNLLKQEKKDKDGNVIERYTYEYSGRIKTKQTYYATSVSGYYFDNEGNYEYGSAEHTVVSTYNPTDGKLTSETVTRNGQEMKYTTYYSDGRTTHTQRVISARYSYEEGGYAPIKTETTYNEHGAETLIVQSNVDGSIVQERTTNEYYEDGTTLKTKTHWDYHGDSITDEEYPTTYIPSTTVTQYNIKGKITSEVETNERGEKVSGEYNEYYDDNETIAKQTEYSRRGFNLDNYSGISATRIQEYDANSNLTSDVYKEGDATVNTSAEILRRVDYTYNGNQTTIVTYAKRGDSYYDYDKGEYAYIPTEETMTYKTLSETTEYGTHDTDYTISDVKYDVSDRSNPVKMIEVTKIYASDDSPQVIKQETYNYHARAISSSDYIPTKTTIEYTASGRVTHSIEINTNNNGKLYETTNEYYDDENETLKKETYYDYQGISDYSSEGHVYSPTITVSEYNIAGKITNTTKSNATTNEKMTETTNEYFDDNTTIKKKTEYNYHGQSKYEDGEYVYTPTTTVTEYNTQNKITHNIKTADGVKLSETINTYQTDGITLQKKIVYTTNTYVSYYSNVDVTEITDYDADSRITSAVTRLGDNTVNETGDLLMSTTYVYDGNKITQTDYVTRGGSDYVGGETVYYPTETQKEYLSFGNSYNDKVLRQTSYKYDSADTTQKTKTEETINTWDNLENPTRITQKTQYNYRGEYMYDRDTATHSYVPTITTTQYNEDSREISTSEVTADGTNKKLHETINTYYPGKSQKSEQSVYDYEGEYSGASTYVPTTTVRRWNEQGNKTYERETSEDGNNTIYNDYSCTYYDGGVMKNVEISTNSSGVTTTTEYYNITKYDYGTSQLQKSVEKKDSTGTVTESTSYTYHDNKEKATETVYKRSGLSWTYTVGAYKYYYNTKVPTHVYIEYDLDGDITKIEVKDDAGNTIEPTNVYDA
ncbi:MAG: hypothetical protein K6A44_02775 [bacterium]|nr:hypothetical protein [bacterium]